MTEPGPPSGIAVGDDGVARCWWADSAPEYRAYHDTEWGFPVADDVRLFEKLSLEGFQAGLSWLTILRKREAFRRAFAGFDYERVAEFDQADVARLLDDAGIVRHRGKIEAVINNARAALELVAAEGSLAHYVWSYEPATRVVTDRRVQGAGQGPQAPWLAVRGSHHRVRVHAGDGPGQRSPRRLSRRPARRCGPRTLQAALIRPRAARRAVACARARACW